MKQMFPSCYITGQGILVMIKWYVKGNSQYTGFTTQSATSGQGEMGQFSHLGSTSLNIPLHLPHVPPQCRHILPPSKPHIWREPHMHSDHYCVGALDVIALTKA